ncbi:response regulator transcription factor [Kineosporia sp. NBRC 101731]|uniref:response regulator transcription factor n=1 Tax=Kineosporia sp. NBRC 101731 TaxID=3032199 RepID=UPI0024A3D52E|nr:response regulator transcription factor [Kineosporia sp. NBRC 101731]GLY33538.1 hypothetical protein Kisp02_69030 [Kineosporia sp. NBRC 101731]
MRQGGVEIVPCADMGEFPALVADPDMGWLLFAAGLDDHHIEQTLWRAQAARSDIEIGLLGARHDRRRAERWIRRGCAVYLELETSPRRVIEAMDLVHRLRVRVIDSIFHEGQHTGLSLPRVGLTRRERDVLQLLDHGHRNSEIAGFLHISENTVEYHIRHILQKLGVRNRMEACRQATVLGLI